MTVLNTYTIERLLQKRIQTSSDPEELLILFKTVQKLGNSAISSVATVDDLPSVSEGVGKLYYVEEEQAIYFVRNQQVWWLLGAKDENFVWGMGLNTSGQLGDGTTISRLSPTKITGTFGEGFNNWTNISAGTDYSVAINNKGELWVWGNNALGKLGTNDTVNRSSPVTVAGGGTNWKQIRTGVTHSAAIKTDGTLWTWGNNAGGLLGTGTTINRSSPGSVAGGGTWVQACAGSIHTAAIDTDGRLWTWGNNQYGKLGDNTTVNRSSPVTTAGSGTTWKQVCTALNHTTAVKTDGTLWTWGNNANGKLGINNTTSQRSPVTTAGGGTTWKQVSAGDQHTVAVKTDGTLWTWGLNTSGQLGTGNTTARSSPVTTAGGGTTWNSLLAGSIHTAAVKTDGTLWTWGNNQYGKLGLGDTVIRSSPVSVPGINTWILVSAGANHTVGIA